MDFLTFKSFISIETLIVFYYMGAIVMPIGLFLSLAWFIQKFSLVKNSLEQGKKQLWSRLTGLQKFKTLLFLIAIFLFMELFWRMLFEFLIAYMQIRDALVTFP
jgi:hypothetical protein